MIYKRNKNITIQSITMLASAVQVVPVRSKVNNIVRRSVFALTALVFFMINLAFVINLLPEKAYAATATVLPDGDVTTNWSGNATPHWSKVDEDTDSPGTGDYIDSGNNEANTTEEFSFDTITGIDSVSNITINIYAQSSTNANGGQLDDVDIQLRINGSLQTATTVTPAYNTWNKYSASFNGTWTQANVDSMQVLLTRRTQGSGNPTNQRDFVWVASVDADITYIAAFNTEQSSYQWFENQDTTVNTTWAQTWGGTGEDTGDAVAVTQDNGFVVAGTSSSYGAGSYDQILTKYSDIGVEVWSKTLGNADFQTIRSIIETSDGSLITVGSHFISGGDTNLIISKFNSSGVEQWSKTLLYTSNRDDYALDVIETSDGGFVLVGYEKYSVVVSTVPLLEEERRDQIITKFNSSGVEQWSKLWDRDEMDVAHSAVELSDGSIVVAGSSGAYPASLDQTLVKYSSTGVEQWSKTWGGTGDDTAYSLVETADGGFAVAGYTTSYGAGSDDQSLVKYNSSGVEQWSKTWGGTGSDIAHSLIETSDGGFAVAGRTASYGVGNYDQTLVKYSSTGVEQWSKTWGGTGSDIAYGVAQVSDGGYLVVGQTLSYGAGGTDISVLKTDTNGYIDGCSACSDQNITESDHSVTEADQTMSESNFNISESDQTFSEVDENVQTLVHCGVVGEFLNTLGGSGSDTSNDVAIDSSGNIFSVGRSFSAELSSDTTNGDQLLVKYNSSGVEQWSKSWGGTGADIAYAVTLDPSGNIYVVGTSSSSGYSNDTTFYDITLVKYNSSGVEQWSKSWGGTNIDIGKDIELDSSGNIYVTGTSLSTGLTGDTSFGDLVLIQFNSSGVEQWSKSWGGANADIGNALKLDSSGNIYVTGFSKSTGYSNDTTNGDQILVKFNSSGIEQWSKSWGGTSADTANDLVLDSSNNIFVVGNSASSGLTAGGDDQTLVKYNSSGIEQWSKTWGGASGDIANGVDIDSLGNIYVTGITGSSGFTVGSNDQTLVKYNSSGIEQWSKTWGGTGADVAESILVDSSDNVYVGGYLGSTELTAGSSDLSLVYMDVYGIGCGGICNERSTSEVDRTITEADHTTSEAGRTTVETDHTVTEVNRTASEVLRNQTVSVLTAGVGAQLNGVSQNTATTAPFEGTPFRLRATVHITTAEATSGDYKLQYAVKSGTCDTSFTGETYSDVTTSSSIAIYTGNAYSDGSVLAVNANDPSHSTDDIVYQEYDADGSFSIVNPIAIGSDGLWDIALVDNGATAFTSYCFRIVTSGGSQLNTYTVIPEITTQGPPLEQSAYRWFENTDTAPGRTTWAQTLGGASGETGDAIILTNDGGFVVAGNTSSFGAGSNDALVTKYTSAGVEVWSKTIGGASIDAVSNIVELTDGSMVLVGMTYSYGAGSGEHLLLKLDSNGIEQWTKTWGGAVVDHAWDLVETSDGGFAVTGRTDSYGAGNADQILVKYNSSGVEQWSKTLGIAVQPDEAIAIVETSDNGLVVVGRAFGWSTGAGGYDQTIVKYNSSGVEQWTKTIGSATDDGANDVIELSDGSLIVVGYSVGWGAANEDQTIAKFNSSGVEQWTKTLGANGVDIANAVVESNDGGFVVVGESSSWGAGLADQTVVKYDSSGSELWTKTWGGSAGDVAKDVIELADGTLVVTGYTASFGVGGLDLSLLKLSSSGDIDSCADCATQTVTESNQVITETNVTIAESNQTITEGNQTITEADQNIRSLVHCGNVGGFLHNWVGLGANTDQGWGVNTTSDDGYVIVGSSFDTTNGAGSYDMAVSKFDSAGVEQWSKLIGTAGSDEAYSVIEDSSQNIIVVGRSANNNNDQWIIKLNSSGVEQWTKEWGGSGNDYAYDVVETQDGGYVTVGVTSSYGAGGNDQTIVKYNSDGTLAWDKTWGVAGSDEAHSVTELPDGSLIVAGFTTTSEQLTLMKLTSTGTTTWVKTWGSTGSRARKVIQSNDGGFLIGGRTSSHGAGNNDQLVAKFDSTGVEQWSKTWGGSAWDEAIGIAQASDGTIVTVGETSSMGPTSQNAFITTLDESGALLESMVIGADGDDRAIDVKVDGSDNIVFTGWTSSFAGGYNMILGKMDLNGNSCGGICQKYSVTPGNVTITEGISSTTTADQTVTITNINLTESNLNLTETVINESIGSVYGIALADSNALASLTRGDEPIRLELLLNSTSSAKTAAASSLSYKLQIAPRIGTCDTSFTGENYVDISTSTDVGFYNNPSLTDGTQVGLYGNSPTYNSLGLAGQSYEESNNFTNPVAIGSNTGYVWDFALSPADHNNGTYCIRAVSSDGSLLSGYNQIVELVLPAGSKQQMRHGAFFDTESEGTKQAFYW